MKLYILSLLILLMFFNSVSAEVEIPRPKIFQSAGIIHLPKKINVTVSEYIEEDLSLALTRLQQVFRISNHESAIFLVKFCIIENLETCNDHDNSIQNISDYERQHSSDEYLLLPLKNNRTNKLSGVALAANTIQGWQYATDWLLDGIKNAASKLHISQIHDYPAYSERSIYISSPLESDLNYWKNMINNAARLRISEISFPITRGKKIYLESSYLKEYNRNLFHTDSPYTTDSSLLPSIVNFAKLRGVKIVPTITHLSSLQLYRYYPDWTMPNGRAVDWRKDGPRNFLRSLIQTAMEIPGVERISIWADEGGRVNRQESFVSKMSEYIVASNHKLGKKIRLRFMLTPIVAQAIRSGYINNINAILPEGTAIDLYGGVEFKGDPGTYHISEPTIWQDIVDTINSNMPVMQMTGVGFLTRSRFNGLDFPNTIYYDSFISEIKRNDLSGQYMFAGFDNSIDHLHTQYTPHRLWSGLKISKRMLLSNLSDSNWLSAHILLRESWEELMREVLLAHFQSLKIRLDKSPTEAKINFEAILTEVNTGTNDQYINILNQKIDKVESILENTKFSEYEQIGKNNIYLSLVTAKFVLNLRRLTSIHSKKLITGIISPETIKDVNILTTTLYNLCDDTQKNDSNWSTVKQAHLCNYLSLFDELRIQYDLPVK